MATLALLDCLSHGSSERLWALAYTQVHQRGAAMKSWTRGRPGAVTVDESFESAVLSFVSYPTSSRSATGSTMGHGLALSKLGTAVVAGAALAASSKSRFTQMPAVLSC